MMSTCFKLAFTLFAFFLICDSQSQNFDSLSVIDSKYDSILRSDGEAMITLFYKHNNDVIINNLGPYGSNFYFPSVSFLYNKNLLQNQHTFKSNLYKLSGIKPYTNITYINASRREQQFSIKHVQEFGKLLFLDFDFEKISSPGIYENQEAKNTNFSVNLKYRSKKDNYEVLFSNEILRNFYEENGGLDSIGEFENSLFDDARNYEVNLKTSNSFVKRYGYRLDQRLDLLNLSVDSTSMKKVYLKYSFAYSTQQKVFYDNDPLSEIYNNVFLDTNVTIDSIFTNSINSVLSVGIKSNNFTLELFGQYDKRKYLQSFGVSIPNHNAYIGVNSEFKKDRLSTKLTSKIGAGGYIKNDIESEVFISYDKDNYDITGGLSYFLNEPDLKYVYYNSNHFEWENTSFDKQSILSAKFAIRLKESQLEFKMENKVLSNTLYFDSLAIANQDKNSSSMTLFALSKDYRILNFYFRSAVIYQLTSNQNLLPLPNLVGRQILYYQKYIFNNGLKLQLGMGFSYSTDYYGYAYMPATGEFYVQNETKLGHYPRIDVFINTHLKRAQIFFKYEHINAGNSLDKSYMVPGYPPMNRSFKFGVSWNMFD